MRYKKHTSGIMLTPNSHMHPVYCTDEKRSVQNYLDTGGWIMEHTQTRELENMICEYTGARFAHMVPSATMGLLLCSMLSNLKQGETFDCPAYTQAATANGAILIGAVPRIIDVDPVSYTINFAQVKSRVVFVTTINGRTPPNYQHEIKMLQDRGHFVIEDAAQSLGSWHRDSHIGTIGQVGVFSFGAPKIITTGQGGCIVTNDVALSEQIHAIKNFGRTVGIGETYNQMGLNFKFTDLQASFGIEQMRKLPEIVQRKKEIYSLYQNKLNSYCDFVETDLEYCTPTYPEIIVEDKDKLSKHLTSYGIGNRAVYSSLSKQPFHKQWATSTPTTDWIANRGLQLPSQADLLDYDINELCLVIKDFYKP